MTAVLNPPGGTDPSSSWLGETLGSPLEAAPLLDTYSWILFAVLVLGLLSLDLFVFHRDARPVAMREASIWVGAWVALGLAFAGFIFLTRGTASGGEYLAG